ncbi:MAG TPA: M14 family zinc carboxypeptidase [Actinomycetota bacterium]|nr:M14 family zinc carboxypeptidase [Actinomycetota bacterium]
MKAVVRNTLRLRTAFIVGVLVAASGMAIPAPAGAQLAPPWDGEPISAGLGPTYGEEWCASAAGENVPQNPPLALIPYAAIACTLEQFQAEAEDAGVPPRMEYEVIGRSAAGRAIYGVVVNALETPAQRRDFSRWQRVRDLMFTDPAAAQGLLAGWGENVKLPMFIEANIHGGEREGTDAMMQVIRDLTTLPRGTNPVVDDLLDHSILVVIPTTNPDGRVAGLRRNPNDFDLNRDFHVQSQPEVQANVAYQLEWLAPVGLALHGYYNPTLIDGLTKPHNPGLEYDKFLYWNQRRLDANEAAMEAAGFDIQRPVNEWDETGTSGVTTGGPAVAEGWDDWGPFYTQTYMAFFGVDGSTVEMCNDAHCGGRLGSKTAQYVTFYSSADFWLENRNGILRDQLEIFRRGVAEAARPNCCDDPLIARRGFTEEHHNWMVEYPEAFVIPFDGGAPGGTQRSDAEANRMVRWLLDNGIEVHRATAPFTWEGRPYPVNSYVVWMDQAMRGLAYTALSAGQDISDRISQLYAPPGAWSHGWLWGADVLEVDDPSFAPATAPIGTTNALQGGVRSGAADWYAVMLRGVREVHAVLDLLRSGVDGEVAEEPFTTPTGGDMPAGSVIFANDSPTLAALQAAGQRGGIFFEPGLGAKPATTQMDEAPNVAILVNSAEPAESDQSWSLRQIFGPNVGFVSVTLGRHSLQKAAADPLRNFDVIYNIGQPWPTNSTARNRLRAFFERGGGYIGSGFSSTNFSFLNSAVPALISGSLSRSTDSADGGIARWRNIGADGPITGGYTQTDNLYLPSSVTWFSSVPSGADIDGRYLDSVNALFVAGLWRDRSASAANAPVVVHGTTTVDSRYVGLATDPFSRGDAEREWLLIGQAALWSNLTDD